MRCLRKKTNKRGLTKFHAHQLAFQFDFLRAAWGELHEMPPKQRTETLHEMHEAWQQPQTRQQAEAAYYERSPAWSKCWAWWQFSSPQPQDEDTEEHLQLYQMGLLSREEAAQIALESHQDYMASHYFHGPYQLFRRLPSWWALCAPEQRRAKETELQQLARLQQLTEPEQELLTATPEQLQYWNRYAYVLQHLTEKEKQSLGLLDVCNSERILRDEKEIED